MTRLRAWILGVREFRSSLTTSYGPDLIETYDRGREFAHWATLRHWDSNR